MQRFDVFGTDISRDSECQLISRESMMLFFLVWAIEPDTDDLSFIILARIWFLLLLKLSPAFADEPSSWSNGSTVIIAEMVVQTAFVATSWICLFVNGSPLPFLPVLFFLRSLMYLCRASGDSA